MNLDREGYFAGFYTPSKMDMIEEVKADIAALLEENKKLEAEYKRLQARFQELQAQVQEQREKSGFVEAGPVIVTPREDEPAPRPSQQAPMSELRRMEQDFYPQFSQSYVPGTHMDATGKKRLLELQLADLEYEKRELELELKIKEFRRLEAQRKKEWETQSLQDKLQASIEQERELARLIEESKENAITGPRRMPFFRRQNKRLTFQVEEAQKKLDFQLRENDLLKDKIEYTTKLMEGPLARKQDQKAQLEKQVAQSEEEYSELNEKVEASLVRQEKKKKLIQQIVDLDRENQLLRQQISNLQDQISSIERGFARRDG